MDADMNEEDEYDCEDEAGDMIGDLDKNEYSGAKVSKPPAAPMPSAP